jgi:hypothetical protein
MAMGRPPKAAKEKLVEVPCKVAPEVAEEIALIADRMLGHRSQVARLLISRGLAAYRRDGRLDEPAETERSPLKSPATRIAQKERDRRQLPLVARSVKKKRDKIDEAIERALTYGGKPVSERDRRIIRETLEQQIREELKQQSDKESKESP